MTTEEVTLSVRRTVDDRLYQASVHLGSLEQLFQHRALGAYLEDTLRTLRKNMDASEQENAATEGLAARPWGNE